VQVTDNCALCKAASHTENLVCAAVFMSVTDTQVRQAQVIVDLSALWRVNLVSMFSHSGFSSRLCSEGLGFVSVVIFQGNPSVKHCTDIFHLLYQSVVSFQCKMQLCHCKSMSKIHGASPVIMNFNL
jgi:hypothetical protein